ncbi:hypothetical protein N431DRAFT_493871 [Stipitochalara longipes BDJ]|nr:hypothetical protein N431DRAFT_493871 [Stipitochalara longipes BDJ]
MASFLLFKGEKLISSSNYIDYMSYINGTETSPNKELYYKVIDKLDDKGKVTSSREEPISPELELICRYFNKIINNNYNSFNNMDEYTKTMGQSIPKPIMAWLILKGLPSSYDNYTSRKYKELASIIKDS